MSKRVLWVVEMRFEDLDPSYGWGEWFASTAIYTTRKEARENAQIREPDEQNRVVKYTPSTGRAGEGD